MDRPVSDQLMLIRDAEAAIETKEDQAPDDAEKGINGYVFIGKYLSNDHYYCQPEQLSEMVYRAGFFVDVPLLKSNDFLCSIYDKTTIIMDKRSDSGGFHPAGGIFNIGMKMLFFNAHEIRFEHECWHPIDSNGDVGEYNLLEYRLHF